MVMVIYMTNAIFLRKSPDGYSRALYDKRDADSVKSKRTLLSCGISIMIVSLFAIVGYCDDIEVVKVRGRGVGIDKTEALKDAYRNAIESAVGLYVDAEQMVQNEDLVKDQILTQSNAYIESYKVVKTNTENGLVSITILADVRKLALTRRIRDVMPDQRIALSEVSKNLHAEIVTDFTRKSNAVALLKNELENLVPVKQLMKVSLGSEKPVFEPVEEDASLVRVWYPIKVEVDKERYYKEFVPRMNRILEQLRVGSPKRFDLVNNLKCAKEYEDYVTKKFGSLRTGRTGVMTRSAERRKEDNGGVYLDYDALKEFGLALNEEYKDICFLDTTILGKRHVFYGVKTRYFGVIDDEFRFDIDDFTLPFFKDHSWNPVYILEKGKCLPEDCVFYVGIISRRKGHSLSGQICKIPYECVKEIVSWQERNVGAGNDSRGSQPKTTLVKSVYELSFVDKSGDEVVGSSVVVRNMDVFNFTCNMLEGTKHVEPGYTGGTFLWSITPLVGGFAESYVKWVNIVIPKDDVAKIADVVISVEE